MDSPSPAPAWLSRPVVQNPARLLTVENLLIALVLLLAILSRFAMLGERVMSHDEVNHVVPSYDLYQGRGYQHNPVTHGPFQFHIVALSYFLLGDSDFSARVPAALFSVAAVGFLMFAFRRYLGRAGALAAGVLFLISPYMLFYGRYTRNEGFIELLGVMLLYGMLRYLERGDRAGMFLVTFATVMHFCVKETSFIYTAQSLIFLFFMFLLEVRRAERDHPGRYNRFMLLMLLSIFLVFVALGLGITKADGGEATSGVQPTAPAESAPTNLLDPAHLRLYGEVLVVAGAAALAVIGLFGLARDIGWQRLKNLRSFSLLILVGTLILPILSALPVSMLGWDPLNYTDPTAMLRTGAFVVLFFAIAAAIGLWWNPMIWLQNAFLFYAIFTVFYTTFFTNGNGFFTGIVGSLGYWLSQQGVERGSQPRYYYALIQMPVYEFLAYLGTILAVYFGIKYRAFSTLPGFAPARQPANLPVLTSIDHSTPTDQGTLSQGGAMIYPPLEAPADAAELPEEDFYAQPQKLPVLGLFIFWSITSMLAYSLAGERMPWLTVHVAMGFLLSSAWGLGYLIDTTDWRKIGERRALLAVLLIPVLLAGAAGVLSGLLSANQPFAGNTLDQLQDTNRFIFSVIGMIAAIAGIRYLLRGWAVSQVLRLVTVFFFASMALLTARAAYRASFINYDYATEYLVYAHAAPGPKQVLAQIEEISRRTSGDKSIKVAYSSDMLYPYWWYLRDYPNHLWFQSTPTRELRDYTVIVAGEDVYNKIDQVVDGNFTRFDYLRLWWPNQDYYNLTWERVWNVIRDPAMRSAVFQIWLNRDYTAYAALTNQIGPLSLQGWSPAASMRVYIRNDVVSQIWEYGAAPAALNETVTDPYAGKTVDLAPVQVLGSSGSQPGQFQAPRGIKVAPDGSLYIADSRNHRIQHIAADGTVLAVWGTFGDVNSGTAAEGSFNEPWDVAIGADGSVFVSDTWNHRIQKFTADGQFLKTWGVFGQGETPDAFWGPRGLAVDKDGRLYVMDTGNKRVVIFDPEGNFISQFGTAGLEEGQFDEPVGIAIDDQGSVFVTDTWNQRVQMFSAGTDMQFFLPLRSWEVAGWQGQSLDNKPFVAVSPVTQHVFITDPESPRVIEYDQEGNIIRAWGDYSTGTDGFGIASGVAVAPDGSVWVSDGANNVLLRFTLPE